MPPRCLLVELLCDPFLSERLTLRDWETVIRQGRASATLVRLAVRLQEEGLLGAVMAAPQRHLQAAITLRDRQRVAVRWEVEHLRAMLASVDTPLLLLKGAAYEMADLPPGRCRVFTDFDLLVPRDMLDRVEVAALSHGWASGYHDAYDQRYYRQWMHELPPMRHIRRHSVIDIHHNLVPDTAKLRPDPRKLIVASVPCPNHPDVYVLSPPDMILHSAVHLFHDGEFDHGLRDLFDLWDLVTHCIRSDSDWQGLVKRAAELNLSRPLYYAMRYLQRCLDLDVPKTIAAQLKRHAPSIPEALSDVVIERGLLPAHETCTDHWSSAARFVLYVRGHALHMPMHLLLPHLLRKGLKAWNLLSEKRRDR